MTRIKPYDRTTLEGMPVAGAPDNSLRGYIRSEIQAGNITGVTGTQVAGMDKLACVALLMGEAAPLAATPAAPYVPSTNGNGAHVPAPVPGGDALAPLAAMLAPLLFQMGIGGSVDRAEVSAMAAQAFADQLGPVADSLTNAARETGEKLAESFNALREEMLKQRPVEITVQRFESPKLELGRQHFLFPQIMALAMTRTHGYLVGPAGSGKTTVCHYVANALGLTFDALSVCQQSTKTDLLGYMSATGEYIPTAFRRLYENGGVFVLDEVDNGNANVLAVLNGAIANDGMTFPDKRVQRHPDFVLIAAGNTYGSGADRLYVGRNQLDAATLDRFAFLDFPYDEGFEMALCGVKGAPSPAFNLAEGGTVRADEWVAFVQAVRDAVKKVKVRHVVSPRASIYGVRLAGAEIELNGETLRIGRKHIERMLIWKGLDAATEAKIRAAMK